MSYKMVVPILEGEFWYGGFVYGSECMPFGQNSCLEFNFYLNRTPNQAAPLLLSNKGRYLWDEKGFYAEVRNGKIKIDKKIMFRDGLQDLRGAYLDAMQKCFPFREITLASSFFESPIYNTWIEMMFNQNQHDILKYAEQILENKLPPGILMIDDGWSDYYGKWTFNKERFHNAEMMLEKLHQMGFKVMVWICPYITPDTGTYRNVLQKKYLIMDDDQNPMILKWWNGYSAALDLSNPEAIKWLDRQLDRLRKLGVDGFKFDAGDSSYYKAGQLTYRTTTPDEMSKSWCLYGEKYEYNEFRSAWNVGGRSLMQRLCDKPHSWGKDGIQALIPDILTQGILGMPFGSPDMIGGGEYLDFQKNSEYLDQELFVRHSEIACMMPVMQFSAAPWRVLEHTNFEKIKDGIEIRKKTKEYLMMCVDDSRRTGEPIVRYMEYAFPNQNMERVTDQFVVGNRLIVAPVYEKGKNGRTVIIPKGEWVLDGRLIVGTGKQYYIETKPGIPAMLWKKE